MWVVSDSLQRITEWYECETAKPLNNSRYFWILCIQGMAVIRLWSFSPKIASFCYRYKRCSALDVSEFGEAYCLHHDVQNKCHVIFVVAWHSMQTLADMPIYRPLYHLPAHTCIKSTYIFDVCECGGQYFRAQEHESACSFSNYFVYSLITFTPIMNAVVSGFWFGSACVAAPNTETIYILWILVLCLRWH